MSFDLIFNKIEIMKVQVENIKCSGCITSIKNELKEIPGVISVDVDLEKSEVTLAGEFEENLIIKKLDHMGYPVVGHNSLMKKAKSYVSCAIGKINE
jgi:copper chaperone